MVCIRCVPPTSTAWTTFTWATRSHVGGVTRTAALRAFRWCSALRYGTDKGQPTTISGQAGPGGIFVASIAPDSREAGAKKRKRSHGYEVVRRRSELEHERRGAA